MVTLVEREQPLDPIYTQPTPGGDDDLDVQPSRGPREAVNIMGDIIDNYFEENLTDVLKVSGLGSNFSTYLQLTKDSNTTVRLSERPDMALEWYVPDSTNRQLVNILDKMVANFKSPGGGMGSNVGIVTATKSILWNGSVFGGPGYRGIVCVNQNPMETFRPVLHEQPI